VFTGIASAVRPTCLLVLVSLMAAAPGGAQTATVAELPRVFLDTAYVPTSGATIAVAAGGDLQAALDAARPGDLIELQAGATFLGNFTLPDKPGAGWIHVQSSALALLSPPGTRVSPALATLMPKIVSPNALPAITAAPGAHHYRFVGVEITATLADTTTTHSGLIALDAGTDLVFDRCYIHGTPTGNYKQGIRLNSARTAVVDSYLADFHSTDQDAQAIVGWNGPGPFKIVNNYLEASGENVLFGGADPVVVDLVPADIEMRRNYFVKPLAWRVGDPSYAGIHWIVKNLLELKNARRVLVDGNLFEHSWQDAQGGTAIVLTVRNQDGAAPWSVVEDVTVTNNIVRHTGSGFHMHAQDDIFPSQPTKRILIRNNLFDDVNSARWGGSGRLFQSLYGIDDLVIDHNTGFMDQAIMMAVPPETGTGFVYTNNLTPVGAYGFTGVGTSPGIDTLNAYFPGAVFARNVLAGPWERGDPSLYPPDNFFPASLAEVAFVDLAGGIYRLAAVSPYKNAGTDGKDIGADIDAIEAAIAGVGTPPPTTDTTPPTVAVTAPPGGATVSGTVLVAATASDNVGVVGVQFRLNGANFGAEVAPPPYTVAWNTTTVPNGTHSLAAVARDGAGNRTTSAAISVTVANADTTVPTATITSPTSSSTYSTSTTPMTLGGTASDNLAVTQVTWTNSRGGSGTATGTTSWTASGIVLQSGSNVLTVTARDAAGNTGTATLTVTLTASFTFTDDPLTAQNTLIKGVHIVELRAAINSARMARGLPSFDWTDPTLTPGSIPVTVVHLIELRTALNQAYQAAGRTPPAYTDATVVAQQAVIRAIHLTELRAAVRAL